jgi:hypothetical protein
LISLRSGLPTTVHDEIVQLDPIIKFGYSTVIGRNQPRQSLLFPSFSIAVTWKMAQPMKHPSVSAESVHVVAGATGGPTIGTGTSSPTIQCPAWLMAPL